MSGPRFEVVIIGSGFSGSLAALMLHRLGRRVLLTDRACHPRFAIGESTTPIGDYVLKDLAERYDLPRLLPLAKYGTWRRTYPDVTCGLKRGFSYFHHAPGAQFPASPAHEQELLVAASADDEHGDTHWLRSDVDAFLVGEVQAEGIPYLDRSTVRLEPRNAGWQLVLDRAGQSATYEADFVLDATGDAGLVPRRLGIPIVVDGFQTHSSALFGHFAGVTRWRDILIRRHAAVDDHPFDCDAAAVHHLVDEGWMWQLRFQNDVTSVGWALDESHGAWPVERPDDLWQRLVSRYPSLVEQLAAAECLAPEGGIRRTGRLQRRAARFVGPHWALLPNTAGFVDPLHSTGIAQSLCGLEHLADIVARHWGRASLPDALAGYERTLDRELRFIDQIVAGGYQSRCHPRLFAAFAMLYFAAATTYEQRRVNAELEPGAAFLCADDEQLAGTVTRIGQQLQDLLARGPVSPDACTDFERTVAEGIRPYNTCGLCDPAAKNMYRYTAAPVAPRSPRKLHYDEPSVSTGPRPPG